MFGVTDALLTISSNRNYFCLLHEALSWARIMFGITDALLNISSTRNYLYIFYGAFNMAMITLGVVGLPLTIPSTRNLFFPPHCVFNRVRFILDDSDFPLICPSSWNHLLLLHWHISQQADYLFLTILYHWFWSWRLILLPFHWNMDRSLDSALSCYAQQAGVSSFPAFTTFKFSFCPDCFQPYL